MSAPQETIHIRAAGLEDASALATLNATVQSLHARLVPELFKPAGAETYDQQAMQRIVAQEDTIVLLAFVADAPVGYAYVEVYRRAETPHARASSEVYLSSVWRQKPGARIDQRLPSFRRTGWCRTPRSSRAAVGASHCQYPDDAERP